MCEFCGNEKDIIFPFQLHKCQRCEGEHAVLGAGLGGPRSPLPRPSIPHAWRDWKPRRLSNILLRDMREGEGGEEAPGDGKSRAPFQFSTDGSKGDVEEQQEEAGGGELEVEGEKHEKGGDEGGGACRRKAYRKLGAVLGERRVRREVNLLKTLHIDRLKKSFSRGDSDSESIESPEDAAQERKHFWNVPKLTVFPKRDRKDEGIKEEKEDAEGRELAEDGKVSDKSAETERSSEELLSVLELFRAQKTAEVFSRGRTEEDRGRESDGKTERGSEEGEATIVTRRTWRGRKTRRARRITRGRKIRDLTEGEGGGSESSGEDEGGLGRTVIQTEEG